MTSAATINGVNGVNGAGSKTHEAARDDRAPRPIPVRRPVFDSHARRPEALVRRRRVPLAPRQRHVAHLSRGRALLHGRGQALRRPRDLARPQTGGQPFHGPGGPALARARGLQRVAPHDRDRPRGHRAAGQGGAAGRPHPPLASLPARDDVRARALHGDDGRAPSGGRRPPRSDGPRGSGASSCGTPSRRPSTRPWPSTSTPRPEARTARAS